MTPKGVTSVVSNVLEIIFKLRNKIIEKNIIIVKKSSDGRGVGRGY